MTLASGLKLLLPAIAFLCLGVARAQLLQGTIDGNVSDPTHAAVAGARVTATDEQTNAVRETATNSTGGYTLPTLPPGTYTVTVTAPGFQTYTQTGVVVSVNTVARVDVALKVGQVSESLTVAAQTTALQTDRADVRTDLTTQAPRPIPHAPCKWFSTALAVGATTRASTAPVPPTSMALIPCTRRRSSPLRRST